MRFLQAKPVEKFLKIWKIPEQDEALPVLVNTSLLAILGPAVFKTGKAR
jgi:hypothetical protein